TGTTFTGGSFIATNFEAANLDGATFAGANTVMGGGTNFSSASLSCTDFRETDHSYQLEPYHGGHSPAEFFHYPYGTPSPRWGDFSCRTNFANAQVSALLLPAVSWRYVNLTGATLYDLGAATQYTSPLDLSGAMLSGVNLAGVSWDGVNLGCATP